MYLTNGTFVTPASFMSFLTTLQESASKPVLHAEPELIFLKLAGCLQTKDSDETWSHVDGALVNLDLSETTTAGRDGIRRYLRLHLIDFTEDQQCLQRIVHFPLNGENAYAARSVLPKLALIDHASTGIRLSVCKGDHTRSDSGRAGVFANIAPFRCTDVGRVFGQEVRARYIEKNQIASAVNVIASRLCPTLQIAGSQTQFLQSN